MKKKDAEYWFGKGNELNEAGRFAEAIECYDEATELNPKDENAWLRKGSALCGLARYTEAIECYDKVIELNPEDGYAWRKKGNILHTLEQYDEAIKCYGKAIELHMEDESAWLSKGMALYELDRYVEAFECYDKAIKLNPADEYTWGFMGKFLYTIKRYEEAIKYHNKAIELNSKNGNHWNFKGDALYKLEQFDEAIKCYDEAIKLNKTDKYAWMGKGYILVKLGKYHDAAEWFHKLQTSLSTIFISPRLNDDEKKKMAHYILDDDPLFKNIKPQIATTDLDKYEKVYIQSISIISELYIARKNCVAHYTTKAASQKMLFSCPKFRLSAINHCNDPKEGITLLDYLFDGKSTPKMEREDYVAFAGSFTFNHDYLNQFRLYGKEEKNEGTGVSIVLRNSFFNGESEVKLATDSLFENCPKPEKNKFSLFRCIYIDPKIGYVVSVGHKEEYHFYAEKGNVDDAEIEEYRKSIDKVLKNVREKLKELKYLIDGLEPVIINQLLLNLRYLTKHVAFKEEQECRIVEIKSFTDKDVHPTDDFKHLYIEYLDIRNHVQKIHFGPNATEMKVYRDMLRHHRLKIDCEKSEHPFA